MVPFAALEPVQVSGVTVKLATLHNEEDLRRKDVREGDEVIVTRAGDVIPRVVSPTPKAQKRRRKRAPVPKPPRSCPACGTPTVKPEGGVWTICPNRASCPGQLFQAVKHFVSRGAMDIEGLGEERAGQLLREGLIAQRRRHLRADRGAARRARGLRRDLGARAARVDRAVEGAAVLARPVRARDPGHRLRQRAQPDRPTSASIDALMKADADAIATTPGIGPVLAETIVDELAAEPTQRPDRAGCATHGLKFEEEGPAPGTVGPLAGKTFVITGTLPDMSREVATERIEAAGGKVTNSVSKKTSLRRAGRGPGRVASSNKAQEIGTEMIDEARLVEMLGD